MVFDSYEFAVFFAVVYFVYLVLKGVRSQNIFLLGASYFFYGFWSWKFLALLVATQVIDFYISQGMERLTDHSRRKRLMWLSVAVNMGTLGFFKYFNFFTENLQDTLRLFGMPVSEVTLNIVLPVGISFYTIQEVTYIFDVYKRRVRPADRFVDFALFVSYFPQLVAGPIERAEQLLPQVQAPRKIHREDILEGGWLIFWGLFKKMFVADRIAMVSDSIFASPETASGPMVVIAAASFFIQIYADFSGYSDMAVGLGRLMGFRLMYNFHLPFFAVTPSDFWRRWHISLTQCLRDNIYIPMGGNRHGFSREALAIMTTMTIGGLWHGAEWTFIIWGAYAGLMLVAERIMRKTNFGNAILNVDDNSGLPRRITHMIVMFSLTAFGCLFFRAQSLHDIGHFMNNFSTGWNSIAPLVPKLTELSICVWLLFAYQVAHYRTGDRFCALRLPMVARVALYMTIYLHLTLGAPHDARPFVYFQF